MFKNVAKISVKTLLMGDFMQIAMIQDKIIPAEQLAPIYFDRGIFFGDGVYEVVRSYSGKIFALEDHLNRFGNSLAAIGIEGVDIGQIRQRVQKAFGAAGYADARIYFHITRGSAPRNHVCDSNVQPNFFLIVTELSDESETKQKGIAVSTHPDWRWKRCDIKSLNLLANVLARQDAAKKGCDEAILVDEAGLITEGAGSTFFAIFGQKLQTAPLASNILPSITRSYILRAGLNLGLGIVEQSLTPKQAICADELFIGVTTLDIAPVVKFDDKSIGSGRVGKYTKKLAEEFRLFTVS